MRNIESIHSIVLLKRKKGKIRVVLQVYFDIHVEISVIYLSLHLIGIEKRKFASNHLVSVLFYPE